MSEPSLSADWHTMTLRRPLARSVLLATWINSWTRGDESADALIDGMADTGPHAVARSNGSPPVGLLPWLAAEGVRPGAKSPQCRPVLPIPGDIADVPGPTSFFRLVVATGEAVILDDLGLALTPASDEDGTTWAVQAIESSAAALNVTRPESAGTQIRAALLEATEVLESRDFGERRDAVEDHVRFLQKQLDRVSLPPSLSGPVRETLLRSALVLGICNIARVDLPHQPSSSALTSVGVINELATTARRCLTAASVSR